MNKVLTAFSGKKVFPPILSSLYYRQMSVVEANFFSLVCNTDLHRQKYQKILPLQSLTPLRYINIFSRLKKKILSYVSTNTLVKRSGCIIYHKIGDNIDYSKCFQYFELPDTFQSWFSCMQLHVYMVVLVTVSEKHGKTLRNGLIDTMWFDVEERLNRLGHMKGSVKKKCLSELVEQFNAGFIAYDEGVLADDKALAGACWRMLYGSKYVDPGLLEKCVMYIRKQIFHLHSQYIEDITIKGSISFLPVEEFSEDKKM